MSALDLTPPAGPGFTVAAVVLWDERGRVLTVRKRGTETFMLPGGKIEPGETSDVTAVRETREELGLDLDPAELWLIGSYLTDAANERGHWVRADVYGYRRPVAGVTVQAEIDAAEWVDPLAPASGLAPLTRLVFPVLPDTPPPSGDRSITPTAPGTPAALTTPTTSTPTPGKRCP